MSLYNIVHGENKFSKIFLGLLFEGDNQKYYNLGRYRDTCLSAYPCDDDNGENNYVDIDINDYLYIGILTRNGGGNREYYQDVFDTLREHPDYYTDEDCLEDDTYATIWFRITVSRLLKYMQKVYLANNIENYREIFVKLFHCYKNKTDEDQMKEWIDKFFDNENNNVIQNESQNENNSYNEVQVQNRNEN